MKGNNKASLARHFTAAVQLPPKSSSPYPNLVDSDLEDTPLPSAYTPDFDAGGGDGGKQMDDSKDCILSQDFFCTPDYITPDAPAGRCGALNYDSQESLPCPDSPEKLSVHARNKRPRMDGSQEDSFADHLLETPSPIVSFRNLDIGSGTDKENRSEKAPNYVPQSALALRSRVLPPPCLKNPYIKDASVSDVDPFGSHRAKCAGLYRTAIGDGGLSRYRTDFHEIEKIADGNFSRVFKVLRRIDGCMYAVKHGLRQLYTDAERRKALMEVQALAALGSHENIVSYYSSWFENERLYIQMELCDHSLSVKRCVKVFTEAEILEAMHQIAKALKFIHERGIAHLDVKPDNIYVKNGGYKLGDFGCATLLDRSLPIEEGDARYMPQEILNDKYDNLDKADIFSLGVTIYELLRGSALPESGPQLMNLREGKLPLLPGHSVHFQNLLKVMVDPDPNRRPSAKEVVNNPIFERALKAVKTK